MRGVPRPEPLIAVPPFRKTEPLAEGLRHHLSGSITLPLNLGFLFDLLIPETRRCHFPDAGCPAAGGELPRMAGFFTDDHGGE